ncbi:54S ribosomal protein L10, mitochondrial [[Candida] jaroonii]|uniref:54S ribosomal protein L10, mitochondrial n=1 Tax=[Candida] jaroonii TaxID=467808 RepID=A0ACA9Y380_9ASCO|nr:54S ribosomal protein L10, mitochondrial [[Candida] jaroonii]
MIFGNIGNISRLQIISPLSLIRNSSTYLGKLAPNVGAVDGYKRLGRGQASGKGKTAGRGQKGQKARGKVPRWFEGGQTPFFKRFPIIGFKRPHKKIYNELNLERIQEFWNNGRIPLKSGELLTMKVMKECGLVTGSIKDGVKVLGNGKDEYTVPLNIESSKASAGAVKSIEGIGNSFTAKYYTKLGLRAHIYPETFLLKKGYIPLEARPTHRRDIQYYSSEEKRGYLLQNPDLLLKHRYADGPRVVKKVKAISNIERSLKDASQKTYDNSSSIVKLSDL